MVIILRSLLMIISNMIINLHEFPNYGLLLACILTTRHRRLESTKDLKTISVVVLHSGCTWLVIIHVKNLTKILRSTKWSPITNQKEHDCIGVILGLNVLIHPDLTQNVNRLDTEPLPHSMRQPITTGDIRHTNYFTYMGHIVTLFIRLDLTWAFASTRNIRTFVHPVHLGLSVHGPVHP
uniref:AC5 protein n=1 Tax=Tomato yellow leaf curl Yunnan virus TaxID=1335768 RepID=A0A1C9T759_9GEMI|nr:AC5 protein [Tomato yellow leaf curl Yunnan virus]QIH55832.1 C5 protein [Tomato yellow leaf curl Yunnan virus]